MDEDLGLDASLGLEQSVVARLRAAGCVFAEDEAQILLRSSREHTQANELALEELLARRVAGEPLEHLVGWVEFSGLRLHTAPGVFVPRQRTALLAELATRSVLSRDTFGEGAVFMEAFCGVGPVASIVASRATKTQIHLGDIDLRALECARRNLGSTAQIHESSCLSGLPIHLQGRVDVIAAVPPYVPETEARFLPREATEHESPHALFGGRDGMVLVRTLISEAREWLVPHGVLLIEMGLGHRGPAEEFASDHGYATRAHLGEESQTVVLELTPN